MEQVAVDRPVELTYVLGGSAYRQLIPLTDAQAPSYEVAKPLEEGVAIESPEEPTPVDEPSLDPLPEIPLPPDPRPEEDVRLPTRAAPTPEDVRAMRSELEELRLRAKKIQAEIDAIKLESAKPK
jgi:hypothetical protein